MIVSSTNENSVRYYVLRVFVKKHILAEKEEEEEEEHEHKEQEREQEPSRKRRRISRNDENDIDNGNRKNKRAMELALTVAALDMSTIKQAIRRILTQITTTERKRDIDRFIQSCGENGENRDFDVRPNYNFDEILFCVDRQKASLFQGEEWHEPSQRHIANGTALVTIQSDKKLHRV